MSQVVCIQSVEPVIYGILKIRWQDGHEGIVDLRPVIADGDMFSFLRINPDRFASVQLAELGHAVHWIDDQGDEVGFSTNSLRARADRQAEILRLAS